MSDELDKALLRKYSGWAGSAKAAEAPRPQPQPERRPGPGRPRNDESAAG